MNLMMRRKHWFRRFGIVRFLDPMIRVYRAAFRHFHLLLERRKSKDEQVTQWMIRQTNRHANKELLHLEEPADLAVPTKERENTY